MRVKRKSIPVYKKTKQNVLERELPNIIPIVLVWVKRFPNLKKIIKNLDSYIQIASSSSPFKEVKIGKRKQHIISVI